MMPRVVLMAGLATIIAVAALLVGLAVSQHHRAAPTVAPPIRVAISSDIRGTNPGVTRDGNTDMVLHHVVESLVGYRADLSVGPLLAERIDVSPDHLTYRFTLRDGLRFHNGAPVTSSEVKWSWERMLDKATGFRCRSWYDGSDKAGFGSKIVGIDTPDVRTVVFRLEQPNTVFLDQMASLQCVTAVLHPSSVDPDGEWVAPVGTGPYKITDWQRGKYVELERFNGYRPRAGSPDGYVGARKAEAERVRFMIIPEATVAMSALSAGDIDILPRIPSYLAMQGGLARDGYLSTSDQLAWNTLLIQTRDAVFSDVNMRRALAHAVDVRRVVDVVKYGAAKPNPSAVPVISGFHTAAHDTWWPYDPQRARALLAAAGYRGEPVVIQTNRSIPDAFDAAVTIQAMLVAVGINARLEVVDWATQLANYLDGKFQLSVFSFSARAHPALGYAAFVGSKDDNPAVQWDSPEARALLRAATKAPTLRDQTVIYDRLHVLMRSDVPIIGLYNDRWSSLVRPEIEGYANWSAGAPRLWGVRRKES